MEDKELIYKIQHGNKELLEILIEKYYDDIYRFCYYKTGNSSLSFDKALKELPEKQKEVIILKYYEDLKIKDISKILDEKVPTIKSRLKQGIENLSRYLGKEDF